MTLTIISLAIFLIYLVGIIHFFGIPYSISDTYYLLERRSKNLEWIFTAMCWTVTGFLIPDWFDITSDKLQFTVFFSCAGLLFVGTAPQFKLPLTKTVHYSAAAICCTFSQIWVIFSGMWYLSFISFAIFLTIAYKYKRWMFWIEIAAFTATYAGVLIKYIMQ
ncbi:hypothetical protein [Parabacteroides leei]|uniref:hypothetical protein n=1 Tax=Parabacteroides leei TaxID=2939491 RepID=UPI00189C1C85|nr:hypothetical protein [Parabacteroides goldsteinii]